eukprot:scaffold2715_cov137-Skeletonema_dohrnii-CCMP3373.AAC.2
MGRMPAKSDSRVLTGYQNCMKVDQFSQNILETSIISSIHTLREAIRPLSGLEVITIASVRTKAISTLHAMDVRKNRCPDEAGSVAVIRKKSSKLACMPKA